MASHLPILRGNKGQGLIEALIGLGIIIILFHALASLIIAAYDLLGNARTRSTARHLANERMEEIRNLPYDDIGTVGGIPLGILSQEDTINRNGLDFIVRTAVIFIDDQFDQLAPTDQFPTDYKKARVDVSWAGRFQAGDAVTMVTDISSDVITGGGTLSILVFDSNADPVPQANVHILNTAITPQIDLNLQTDDQGFIILPGSPECDTCYQITATKQNYSTERTYSSAEVANPNKPHASVIEGELTEISFAIDKTADLSIISTRNRDLNFSLLPNKSFVLRSNKTIGTNSNDDPVHKYDQQLQTDATGHLQIPNMEWDMYYLSIPLASFLDLAGSNPLRPIVILPDTDLNLLFASSPHQDNTLLLSVTDASGSAIASASAQLTGPGNYDQTLFTGDQLDPDFGQAFFSPLQSGNYSIQVTNTGYLPESDSISVDEQTFYSIQLNQL